MKEGETMDSFKIVKIWNTNCGDVKIGFVMPDGKVKDLPVVGNVWAMQSDGFWSQRYAVVKSNVYGLLMLQFGKSKVAKPLSLKEGEHFRTVEQMRGGRGYRELAPE
jgi:hypothetical protein